MGFVKGTDGIASTLRNTLEGSVGNIALENISATGTITGNVLLATSGNIGVPNGITTLRLGNTTPNTIWIGVGNADNIYIGNATSTTQATGNLTAGGFISATGNIISAANVTGGNLSVTGNVTGNTAGFAIGYRDIPQVSFSANATIATADAGKHFYSTSASNLILTIANNASQAFQTGSALTIINQGSGNITVAQGSGVTLYLAGNVTAGNRTISTFGMATCIKVATNTWFINGTGVA
jgi:hypothetical protein